MALVLDIVIFTDNCSCLRYFLNNSSRISCHCRLFCDACACKDRCFFRYVRDDLAQDLFFHERLVGNSVGIATRIPAIGKNILRFVRSILDALVFSKQPPRLHALQKYLAGQCYVRYCTILIPCGARLQCSMFELQFMLINGLRVCS